MIALLPVIYIYNRLPHCVYLLSSSLLAQLCSYFYVIIFGVYIILYVLPDIAMLEFVVDAVSVLL